MSGDSLATTIHPLLAAAVVDRLRWPDVREVQELAFGPIAAGNDVVVIAPTAGGKTEAAALPLLHNALCEPAPGVSIVWVAPLRALVENIAERLDVLATAAGRRAAAWHGETSEADRRALLDDAPDILVCTPEALEATFVSRTHAGVVADVLGVRSRVRAVVVDEVHVFAGTDRGGQLLSLARRMGPAVQRIGLSATVGSPEAVLDWMADTSQRTRQLIALPPTPRARRTGIVQVDPSHVADEIAQLATGRRALVFAPTRRAVEELTAALRALNIDAWPHHAGLSHTTRRESEAAFARDSPLRGIALVCTSTLELGVDLPNVDRVIQLGPPPSAASLMQRMGRSGRRPGRIPELAIVVDSANDEQNARTLLAAAKAGEIEPPQFGERHPRLLRQQLLARVAAAGAVDEVVLLAELATLPGLRGFTAAEVAAAVDEPVVWERLRRIGGELLVGDRAAPMWEVCAVFGERPGGRGR